MLRTILATITTAVALGLAAGAATAQDAAAPAEAPPAAPEDWEVPEGWKRLDFNTVSADSLIAGEIRTLDGEVVAEVGDLLLSAEGEVEHVVARFGGVLGFGETTVLLNMDEVDVLEDAEGNLLVRTNLTAEMLQAKTPAQG